MHKVKPQLPPPSLVWVELFQPYTGSSGTPGQWCGFGMFSPLILNNKHIKKHSIIFNHIFSMQTQRTLPDIAYRGNQCYGFCLNLPLSIYKNNKDTKESKYPQVNGFCFVCLMVFLGGGSSLGCRTIKQTCVILRMPY